MNWSLLIIGLIIGWAVEWVIDWLYWRRRTSDGTAEVDNLRAHGNRLRADLESAAGSVEQLKADLATANSRLAASQADNTTLRAQIQAASQQPRAKPDGAAPASTFATQQLSATEVQAALELERARANTAPQASAAALNLSKSVGESGGDARQRSDLAAAAASIEPIDAKPAVVRGAGARDPLIDINGIGPVIEKRLFEAGIYTFAQLAEQAPERLRQIARLQNWQEADPNAWIAEARERAAQQSGG